MAKLYLVPTPIGNLDDITLRAVRVLREVDLILAEDTRTTSVLLHHLGIEKPLRSHHKFNEHATVEAGARHDRRWPRCGAGVGCGHAGHLRSGFSARAHLRGAGHRGGGAARRHGFRTGARAERISVRPVLLRGLPAPEEGPHEVFRGAGRRAAHDDFLRVAVPCGALPRTAGRGLRPRAARGRVA